MISGTSRFEHISPVLMDLHWLLVKKRVDFKLLVITYKALHGLAPAYISNLIELHVPGRHGLRSACTPKLSERRSRRSWGDRSLMVAAPRLWNNLPHDIQHSSTLNTFKSKLKTHFMQTSFKWDYHHVFLLLFCFSRCVIVLKLIVIVIYFKWFFHKVLFINIVSS